MKYNEYFETKIDQDDKKRIILSSNASVELQNLVRDIHRELNSNWPEDWIYDNIYEAFFKIEEEYDKDVAIENILNDIEPAIYNTDLIEWSKSYYAQCLIDEATEELGYTDFIAIIRNGQYKALDIIYRLVHEFINQLKIK